MTRLTESTCCSSTTPHPTIEAMPSDGKTHHVATILNTSIEVSQAMANLHPARRRRQSDYVAVPNLVEPAAEEPTDDAVTIAVLRSQIATALEALRIPKPDEPYNAWVNSGNRWTKAAHEARLALGAEQ